jgi:two-component system sensor histidine kinase DesK
MFLNWPSGVRLRVVIAATALLVVLWFIDGRLVVPPGAGSAWWLSGFFSVSLPSMTVLTLWWWDVLITVDRARASESRLAATQERLRVATDVHDLQGHHLQVIALQLELAERLMPNDPDAALTQLQAARRSVDAARQGTRDLALRFRSVPLPDEVANAADLLRAAGTSVKVTVDADADQAPASVLGPVIRETTTNALRHGGGRWARLSLTRDADAWRYEIENDAAEALPSADGAGLEGIARRVEDGGGTVETRRGGQEFAVVVRVPVSPEGSR